MRMTAVLVGVPVTKDTRKIHIEKGRRWSVFEHAILEALARKDYSLEEIETFANLRARVVVEIVIRLMRAGWVEIVATKDKTLFRATAYGRLNATLLELPPVTSIFSRHLSYAVDLVTGSIFHRSDLTLVNDQQWLKRTNGIAAVRLNEPHENKRNNVPLSRLAQELLEDDEELVRVDPTDWRPVKLIALVTVTENGIDGVGTDVPPVLKAVLQEARRKIPNPQASKPASLVQPMAVKRAVIREPRPVSCRADDLITGGIAHKTALERAIKHCRFRLAIHSTFLNEAALNGWFPLLLDAARRDVLVDVIWGQSSERAGENATLLAANVLRARFAKEGVQSRIRIHASPSRSHAKIIFADTGEPDSYQAIVGSCNWLASRFDAFETSIRLRDAHILADVAFELAELARPPDGNIGPFSTDMLSIGRQLARLPSPTNLTSRARIVLGSEHADVVLDARDNARERILLLSHQMGHAMGPTLKALESAAKGNQNLTCEVFYSRFSDGVDVAKAASALGEFSRRNLRVAPVQRPRLHAKVLAWDDDSLLVSSQNLLSSDPSSDNLRQELGVLISHSNLARIFRDRLVVAKDFSAGPL